MANYTHRYTGTGLTRADGTALEPGDYCAPSDAELRSFGDSFEPLSDDEAADAPDAPEPSIDDVLAEYVDDPTDYGQLQSLASDFEDVPGSGISLPEMRERLADAIRSGDA